MQYDVVRRLRCPVCHGRLRLSEGERGPLTCPLGHAFDQAKGGYAQLTAAPLTHPGDTAAMVAARAGFLAAGHFEPVVGAVVRAAAVAPSEAFVLDLGAGPGHYLAAVLDLLPDARGLAVDAAKPAVRAAARAHPRADAIVADSWQPLPIADGVVDIALDVFAPRPGPELARVLAPHGILVVVTPAPDHLAELVDRLGLLHVDPDKRGRVAAALSAFHPVTTESVGAVMHLSHADVAAVVAMGPSAWHSDPAARQAQIAALPDPAAVTLSATVTTYRLTTPASAEHLR